MATSIVQFMHPGGEHGHDKGTSSHKSWNTANHKRKFLLATGDYIDSNNKIVTNENLMFWGEWELPSRVLKLQSKNSGLLPSYLHIPYVPNRLPDWGKIQNTSANVASCNNGVSSSCSTKNCGENGYQNTDPFVFEDKFKYFLCRQFNNYKTGIKTTALAKLNKGSLILFGSKKGKSTEEAFFQLDTVFVVGDYIEYDTLDSGFALLQAGISQNYIDIVYKLVFPFQKKNSLKLRLYLGASPSKPYEGMYSYSPSKVYKNSGCGFERVRLKNLRYFNDNLSMNFKKTDVELKEITNFWNEIRTISREQGCIEGFNFKYESNEL